MSDFRARTGKTQDRAGLSYNDKNKEVLIQINVYYLHSPVPGK